MASALDIHEIYTTVLSSPSSFMLDFEPDAAVGLIDAGTWQDTTAFELNVSATSSWTSTDSVVLPIERYRRDSQRHERLAVSVALGHPCSLAVLEDEPVFKRSPAPSPSTRLGLMIPNGQTGSNAAADWEDATAKSVVDPDEHDYQSLLRTYSLERWFGATMEKPEELAVQLQHTAAYRPVPAPLSMGEPIPIPVGPDTISEAEYNRVSEESIHDFLRNKGHQRSVLCFLVTYTPELLVNTDASYRYKEPLPGRSRIGRRHKVRKSKRKSEEDHQGRPNSASPVQLSDT
jgi:hypothetical protein